METSTSPSAERPDHPRSRSTVAAVFVAAVVLAGGGGALAVWSPVFHARTIDVTGARHLSAGTVAELAGISSGSNLLWLDTGIAERRLEQDPWVREATVQRSLPGTVRIHVLERTPLAVARDGERLVLIAGDGTRLGPAPSHGDLPRAIGDDLRAAVGVIAPMPRWLRREVDRVSIGEDASVRLILRTGIRVRYGDATETAKKAAALAGLLRWADQGGTELVSVDVRFPDAPTARVAGGG